MKTRNLTYTSNLINQRAVYFFISLNYIHIRFQNFYQINPPPLFRSQCTLFLYVYIYTHSTYNFKIKTQSTSSLFPSFFLPLPFKNRGTQVSVFFLYTHIFARLSSQPHRESKQIENSIPASAKYLSSLPLHDDRSRRRKTFRISPRTFSTMHTFLCTYIHHRRVCHSQLFVKRNFPRAKDRPIPHSDVPIIIWLSNCCVSTTGPRDCARG